MFNSNFLGHQKKLINRPSADFFTKSPNRDAIDFISYKNGLIRHLRNSENRFDKRIIFARKYADYEMRYRNYPKKINIIEVGPTCGLKEKRKSLYKDVRVEFINRLNESGLDNIQIADFSKSSFSCNMKHSRYINQKLNNCDKPSNVVNSMIVRTLNSYNREMIVNKNINEIVLNTGVTDEYNKLLSVECKEKVFNNIEEIVLVARTRGLRVRGGVSDVMRDACIEETVDFIERFAKMDVDYIDIIDSDVKGGSRKAIMDIVDRCLSKDINPSKIAVQIRDYEAEGLLTVVECLDRGIINYKTCVLGLESSILATEKLINFCKNNDIECGDIDSNGLLETSFWVNRFFKF